MPTYHQPFAEQISFFRQKLNLPSERWDSIQRTAHDKAFIVAGAQGADLLADLRGAVGKAIEQGTGLDAFRKDFKVIVAKHGWTGWAGEGSKAGVAWRTKVIYQTNMATSYAAGRWQQLNDPDLLKLLPYWQYKHSDSVTFPRPLHVSWNGLTLPPDHPFWETHFPPNGWGCHCRIVAVSKTDYLKAVDGGRGPVNAPTDTEGIDQGFDYAPGSNTDTSLRQMVQDKLINYPPAIAKALTRDVNRYINAEQDAAGFVRDVLQDKSRIDPLWLGFVENIETIQAGTKLDLKGYIGLLPADVPRHVANSHGFDGGNQRPPEPQDYALIWSVLLEADALRLGNVTSLHGLETIVATRRIGEEVFRCVFEVRPGKRNRAVSLVSLVIKTN